MPLRQVARLASMAVRSVARRARTAQGRLVNVCIRSPSLGRTVYVRGYFMNSKMRTNSTSLAGKLPRTTYLHIQRAQFHDFFGNMGGPGGQGGGGGDTSLYEELGISKGASEKEIKTAYRKLAMKHHPDQGGDTERFTKIQEAYEVLSDPDKRQRYDQFGKAAVDGSMGGGDPSAGFEDFDVNDVFSQFFGGGGRGRPRGPTRTEDMVYNLSLDLEQLYTGMTKKIAVNRDSICSTCDGLGAMSAKDITTCSVCGGRGVVVTTRQMGPIVQQVQSPCTACGGEGKTIASGKQCTTCNGKKLVRERKTFDVNIKAGTQPNSRLVLRGESNQMPGATPGDVVLIVNEKPHPVFKRQGSDLIYEHTISLAEALTGFAVPLKFLDGTTMLLRNDESEAPISPQTISKVSGKGMKSTGDLYVVWKIAMPDTPLADDDKKQLRQILGGDLESLDAIAAKNPDAEEVTLELASVSDRRRRQRRASGDGGGAEGDSSSCRQM